MFIHSSMYKARCIAGLLLSCDMPMVVVVGRRVRYSELFSKSLDVTYWVTSSSS